MLFWRKKLESIIEECSSSSSSSGVIGEDFNEDVDRVLNKLIEEGPELSHQKRDSLRKTIEIMLGIKFSKDK